MRLSDVETDVETGYGGKEIKTLNALGPRDYILSLVNRKNSMESWVWDRQSIAWKGQRWQTRAARCEQRPCDRGQHGKL